MSGYGPGQPLFIDRDGMTLRMITINSVQSQVDGLSEDRILNTDVDELAKYFGDMAAVHVPVLDMGSVTATSHERTVSVRDGYSGGIVQVPGAAFDFAIPFSGDPNIFYTSSNSSTSSPPRAIVEGNFLKFTISGRDLTQEQVSRAYNETVSSVQQYLGWHENYWKTLPSEVARTAKTYIEQRRSRIMKQKDVATGLAALGIKLLEKPGDPRTFVPPAVKQRIVPQLPPMKAASPPQPTLDQQNYETILTLVRGAGRSIEQSSSRTRNLDEEALRDMFLVPLNAHYGSATGEAFNYSGKTDIMVRHDGGILFVAECKIWGGDKLFLDTVDQLLSYLTWRDTKTALIIFNRNVGFSSVLEKMRTLPATHAAFSSGPKKLDESSFEFRMKLPQDPDRIITMTVMGFDLGVRS